MSGIRVRIPCIKAEGWADEAGRHIRVRNYQIDRPSSSLLLRRSSRVFVSVLTFHEGQC